MKTDQILAKFEGNKIELDTLSSYEQWALKFFHDRNQITNPNISITIQLEITEAKKQFDIRKKAGTNISFMMFFYWNFIQTLKNHAAFCYRSIENNWYHFMNLPLYMPVAVGGKERFSDVMFFDVMKMTLEEWCRQYREVIDRQIRDKPAFEPFEAENWELSHFIGNLPHTQFTSLTPHSWPRWAGRPIFYLGQRHTVGDKLFLPLAISFDHANLDPYVINIFINDLSKKLITA